MMSDIAAELEEIEDSGEQHIALVWDFESARRIVPVVEKDWGLQAFTRSTIKDEEPQADTDVYLNTVGTFGFSTAGYWWARLGAMCIRALHYGLGHELAIWLLLFADDGKASIRISKLRPTFKVLTALLAVFGFPVKWGKVKGGTEFQWVGYWIDLKLFKVGVSTARRDWVVRWITSVLGGEKPASDFDSALGRLSFVCGAISFDRPFLAPLYSLTAIARRKFGRKVDVLRFPPYVQFILHQLRTRLMRRHTIHCRRGRLRGDGP